MSRFVSDTHALIWHVTEDPILSSPAKSILTNADNGVDQVLVPGIVLVEIVYLIERAKIPDDLFDRLAALLANERGGYSLAPLDEATARALHRVPRSSVPDMPDRIIVATALRHGLPLLTRDRAMRRSGAVTVVW